MQPQHGPADILTFNQTVLCGSLSLPAISAQQCKAVKSGGWGGWVLKRGGGAVYGQLVDCSSLPECVELI